MDVLCNVQGCPFNTPSKFCVKRLLVINQNGQCGHVYLKNGTINPQWQNGELIQFFQKDIRKPQEQVEKIEEDKKEE